MKKVLSKYYRMKKYRTSCSSFWTRIKTY